MNISKNKLLLLLIFIISIVFVLYWQYGTYVTFEWLKQNRNILKQYVDQNYLFSVVTFILFYTAYAAFSLPGVAVLTLAAGFLFNTLAALVYVNSAATLGATLSFLASRYLIGDYIQKKYENQLITINKNIERYGHYYMLIARLIIIAPFFIVNVVSGLTNIDLWTFMWTTSLGIIPGSLVYILVGRQLSTLESVEDIVSWRFIGVVLIIMLLFMLQPLIKILRKRD